MKHGETASKPRHGLCLVTVGIVVLFAGPAGAQVQALECGPPAGDGPAARTPLDDYRCFPTCAPHALVNDGVAADDGRFVSIAGDQQETFKGPLLDAPLYFAIRLEPAARYLEIGIFDGDTGRDFHRNRWDYVATTVPPESEPATLVTFELYEDSYADGRLDDRDARLAEISGAAMPDDQWCNLVVTRDEYAGAFERGLFFLAAELDDGLRHVAATSNFKIRTNGDLRVPGKAFSFQGILFQELDFFDLYPSCEPEDPLTCDLDGDGDVDDFDLEALVPSSTYDGSWTFFVDVEPEVVGRPLTEVTLWDGDFDHGSWPIRHDTPGDVHDPTDPDDDCDMDDLDSEPAVGLPFMTVQEGVECDHADDWYAHARRCDISTNWSATGCPADDGYMPHLRRSPGVRYSVSLPAPGGAACSPRTGDCPTLAVENPSGNLEWERFRLVTPEHPDASSCEQDCRDYDLLVPRLPAGYYTVTLEGLDLNNLAALYAGYDWVSAPRGGDGCTPGYWKQRQHFDSWPDPYEPRETLFSEVFGVGPEVTLLEALRFKGGGYEALCRHAVAALLNAARLSIDYRFPTGGVLDLVRQAYESGEPEAAKDLLAGQNELGCPLD